MRSNWSVSESSVVPVRPFPSALHLWDVLPGMDIIVHQRRTEPEIMHVLSVFTEDNSYKLMLTNSRGRVTYRYATDMGLAPYTGERDTRLWNRTNYCERRN